MTTQTKPRPATELDVRRFTVAEYYAIAQTGILPENERVELIDGVIVEMAPMGNRHRATVTRLNRAFSRNVGERAIVQIQSSITLDDQTMPEPDLAILRERADFYEDQAPRPEDVLLLIEVSDTSLDYDRNEKLPRYARAGIPEVWLTVLPEGVVEVHTEPTENGYRVTRRLRAGDVLRPGCFEEIEIPVEAIIPADLP